MKITIADPKGKLEEKTISPAITCHNCGLVYHYSLTRCPGCCEGNWIYKDGYFIKKE